MIASEDVDANHEPAKSTISASPGYRCRRPSGWLTP